MRDITSTLTRAVVVSNKDPLRQGRVRVRCPIIHGLGEEGIEDDDLPWAINGMTYSYEDVGSFILPNEGTRVYLLFEDNSVSKPVFFTASYVKDFVQKEVEFTEDDTPYVNILLKDKSGNTIKTRYLSGESEIELIESSGSTLLMKSDSSEFRGLKSIRKGDTFNFKTLVVLFDKIKQGLKLVTGDSNYIQILNKSGSKKANMVLKDGESLTLNVNNKVELDLKEDAVVVKIAGSFLEVGNSGIKLSSSKSVEIEGTDVKIRANNLEIGGATTVIKGSVDIGATESSLTHKDKTIGNIEEKGEENV